MSFFGQSKSRDATSYVDWLRDGYEADEGQEDVNLPWANDLPRRPTPAQGFSLLQFIRGPLEGRDSFASVDWTSSFLKNAAGKLPDPAGFALKLVSLTAIPGLFTLVTYSFTRFMEWSQYPTIGALLIAFFTVLRHSVKRVSDRPKILEVFRLFFHEAAVAWLMWVFGSIIYTLCLARSGFVALSTLAGLFTALPIYFVAQWLVNRRTGSPQILRYLLQVGSIIVTSFLGLSCGYILGPILWTLMLDEPAPAYASYVLGMFFGYVAFSIGVKQFYIHANRPRGTHSSTVRGSDISVG